MPQAWLDLANDARKAAASLVQAERHRSAVARAYYAAYSKVTHELVNTGLTMPKDREGPNHTGGRGAIRPMVETSMPGMSPAKRVKLSELIGRLYTLRVDADYKPSTVVEAREAREAVSMMNTVFDSF
ncbi:MAG TPA: hypothetical protein VLJ39_21615 [Tepidisphaeraceae bacterium]|jgi:uncharacterized protein (UPF0332 family)|nr:hypothetical protein [Tepidisphaeraceae bacterium]